MISGFSLGTQNGSLGIAVINPFLYTDFTDKRDEHGFLKEKSVQLRQIRVIRVQNRGNS